MRSAIGFVWLLSLTAGAWAEPIAKPIGYRHGNQNLEGILAYDPAWVGKRPSLLLATGGAGNGPRARSRALQFAKLGYPTLAIDLFGPNTSPRDLNDARGRLALNGPDRSLIRERAQAGLATLAKHHQCDPARVAGVGFGIGGTALLELARSGADLEAVVCIHGDLSTPNPADGKKISASVLVLVGSEDPIVALPQIALFEDEMRGGGVDWQIIRFGGAANDFTNPNAGRDPKSGAAFDVDADRRASVAVGSFLSEAFAAPAAPIKSPAASAAKFAPPTPKGVPEKAMKILAYIDENNHAMDGYEGGRNFGNFERNLPQNDKRGGRIRYREWDVNPLRPNVNRGAERLVTGSDGSAYFTDDHYRTFKKIR